MLLPILIIIFGIYFLFRLRFFFIRRPLVVLGKLKDNVKGKGSLKSLALALAGTLGVGNIVGVAFGISVGGAGALFWILVSALFSAPIKYCESTVSADMKENGHGGMMYVIKESLGRGGKPLSYIYAGVCLVLAFLIGGAFQSKSIAESASLSIGLPTLLVSLLVAILTVVVIILGAEKIENVTAVIIPLATIVYTVMCLAIVFVNISELPRIISDIFKKAFDFGSFGGGLVGFLTSRAVSEGFARGLLSNEAGAGTSAMAQTRSHLAHPSAVGLFGMCEIFFDTILLCTLSGLAVLIGAEDLTATGMEIVMSAFSSALGSGAGVVFFVLIFTFAYSTIICWYYYAGECGFYLTGRKAGSLFAILFGIFVFLGPYFSESMIIYVSDALMLVLTFMTLLSLTKNAERICTLSADYGLLKIKSKKSDRGKDPD